MEPLVVYIPGLSDSNSNLIPSIASSSSSIRVFHYTVKDDAKEINDQIQHCVTAIIRKFDELPEGILVSVIAKSFGAVLLDRYLSMRKNLNISKIVILGLPVQFVNLDNFYVPTYIIQGSKDKYSKPADIKKILKSNNQNILVVEKKGLNHSFTNTNGKNYFNEIFSSSYDLLK